MPPKPIMSPAKRRRRLLEQLGRQRAKDAEEERKKQQNKRKKDERERKAAAKAKAEADAKAEAEAKAEADAKAEAEPKAEAEAKVEAELDAAVEREKLRRRLRRWDEGWRIEDRHWNAPLEGRRVRGRKIEVNWDSSEAGEEEEQE
jgi:membrane protein involved in colicin uptake